MKTRRGISSDIVQCDGFISMPSSAQALYMHLILTCDDEGFTSKMAIAKSMAHASDDDEKVLLARGFIIQFRDEYKVVTVIKHWWANNYMRGDRITKSEFAERSLVYKKDNGSYTTDPSKGVPLIGENQIDNQVATKRQPTDNPTLHNNTKQSITEHNSSLHNNTKHTSDKQSVGTSVYADEYADMPF